MQMLKIAQPEVSEINEIPAAEDSMSSDDLSSATDNGITQAQVYDNLKRIGELEDEKKRIQDEIQDRTEQFRWPERTPAAMLGGD